MHNFNPMESAGFLVGRVAHGLKLAIQEFLDENGIPVSAEEISILTVMSCLEESLRMKPLAEILGRDPTTVSRQIAGLERQELVKRSPCPNDGRATVVQITNAGQQLVERTLPLTLTLRKQAMQGISPNDEKAMQRALQQMIRNLRTD